ncbi:hypothetical protein Tco_1147310, partial [Tanacetum coccineum]
MYYPRFTKAIIHHFLSKDKSISMRNRMFIHTAQDDSILGILRFVSKDEDTQVYGALLPAVLTTPHMQDSYAYQTYLTFATGAKTPKLKRIYKKHDSLMIKTTTTSLEEIPSKRRLHLPRKMFLQRSLQEYSQLVYKSKILLAALLEDAQMKKVLKWSKRENHSLQVSGLGTSEGTDVNDDGHDDDIDDDGNDDESDDDGNNNASDDEKTESGDDENPNLNKKDDDKEEEYEEEYVHTPEKYESTNDESEHMDEEEYDRINEELYNDV